MVMRGSGFLLRLECFGLLALAFVACLTPRLMAQTAEATIVGTCVDPSGAVVPKASVTAKNVSTNALFNATTNVEGNYIFPILPIGAYELSVSATGFETIVRSGIVLQVGDRTRVDFTLKVGSTVEKVDVVGAAPLVQTDSSGLGDVVENERITDLPLNSRNVLTLETLVPGVRNMQGGIDVGFGRSQNYQVANVGINGSTSGFTAFLMDGADDSTHGWGEVSVAPLVDAIQEFQVMTNFIPPEYGFTAGGVVNTITKGGTNSLHGSAYEFVRNNVLDARNTFAPSVPPYRFNQFGASLGGPILIPKLYNGRDKTFFFFNYEGSRHLSVANPITTVPTPAERTGDFSQLEDDNGNHIILYDPATTVPNSGGSGYLRSPLPGNIIPTNRLDKVAQNVLSYLPLPNLAPNNPFSQTNNYIGDQPETVATNQIHARVDHSFGSKNRLFGRWSFNAEDANRPDDAGPWPDPVWYTRADRIHNQQAVINDVHTFSPSLLNEVRLTVMEQHFPFTQGGYDQGWPQKIGLPADVPPTLFPLFNIDGLATLGGDNTTGIRDETTFQIFDMISKIHGNHSLKFGTDLRHMSYANYQAGDPSGSYNFPSTLTGNPQNPTGTGFGFATFLLGAVGDSSTLDIYNFPTYVGHSYSFFAGDDWKVTRRLTLNLGLRYDFQSPPVERGCHTTDFNPSVTNPDNSSLLGSFQYACVDYGKTVVQNDRTNFAPRIGFAYDLTGDARTVLRGAYATIYAPTFTVDNFPQTQGYTTTNVYLSPGNNPNLPAFMLQNGPPYVDYPAGPSGGPSAYLGSSVAFEERRRPIPYTEQWDLDVQHQFPGKWVLDVAYAGSTGVRLPSNEYNYDQLGDNYLSLGLSLQNLVPNPLAGQVPGPLGGATVALAQTLEPYPQYSSVSVFDPYGGSSTYHSLQVKVEHRVSQNLTVLASYTYAKLISGSLISNIAWMSTLSSTLYNGYQDGKFDRNAEKSVDPTDVPQAFVLSYVYKFPLGRGHTWALNNSFTNAVLGNWSMSGVFTADGGPPLIITGANNFLAERPDSTGQSAKLASPNLNEWFNPNVFVNPPNYQYGNLGRTLGNVRAPGLTNFDFALLKDFPIKEKFTVQFRAESFNVANITNLGLPNTTFVPGPNGYNFSGTFGTITSAYDPRSIQFGLKLIW
ncbi:MAG: TonB-dependent receptor [Terriglobia bacterium]|jgi:outer membrane receptor protein involved in Fe transport